MSSVPNYLVINSSAGSGNAPPDDLFDGFTTIGVDTIGEVFSTAALDASSVVAAWGGDGTCRAVVAAMLDTDATLLPCPGGTHNHFARAASLEDADDVRRALTDGVDRFVDVGIVGREPFLNNLAIGWYVDLVARRERYQQHVPRRIAKIASVVVQLGLIRRLHVQVDGVDERVWLVWVGNGRYSERPTELTQRESLEDGLLDLRVLRAHHRLPKLRALAVLLRGNAQTSPAVERRLVRTCTVSFRHASVRVAMDGELVRLPTPLLVRCRPSALRLRVPRSDDDDQEPDRVSTNGAMPSAASS